MPSAFASSLTALDFNACSATRSRAGLATRNACASSPSIRASCAEAIRNLLYATREFGGGVTPFSSLTALETMELARSEKGKSSAADLGVLRRAALLRATAQTAFACEANCAWVGAALLVPPQLQISSPDTSILRPVACFLVEPVAPAARAVAVGLVIRGRYLRTPVVEGSNANEAHCYAKSRASGEP